MTAPRAVGLFQNYTTETVILIGAVGDSFVYTLDNETWWQAIGLSARGEPFRTVGAALDAALDEDAQTTEYRP
jgi:hypothetical protein